MKIPPMKLTKDKVAIVGFAGTSRHMAPYLDDEWEIWSLNEAHRQPWVLRLTRWFQVHQKWDFTKQNQEAYVEHWKWLQEEHDFPIYMQEEYPECPSSVKYPLDEIVDKFLSNVRRGADVNRYFTSSFAYMCALALYLGAKEIAVFGFEMATDTEYRYQKGSTEYWLGIATGLGVKIYLPEQCKLLAGALYGWEVSRMINRQRLEWLRRQSEVEFKMHDDELQRIFGRRQETEKLMREAETDEEKWLYNQRVNELLQNEVNQLARAREALGYVHCLERLIQTVDNMHAGRDPGDGYYGPEGDLDPDAEQAVQEEAEAKAKAQETASVQLAAV